MSISFSYKVNFFLVIPAFFFWSCIHANINTDKLDHVHGELATTKQTKNCITPISKKHNLGDQPAVIWEYEELSVQNPSWSGNPFNLVATVTFEHLDSDNRHITEMFYVGNNIWKFRFTGTKLGKWSYTTSSSDPELHGLTGEVNVIQNPSPEKTGFLTTADNKFAVQTQDIDTIKPYIFNVYMNEVEFPSQMADWKNTQDVSTYLQDAKNNGSEIIFFHVNNSWFKFGVKGHDEHNNLNPDLCTFRVLEKLITNTRELGGRTHLWAWGDDAPKRKWTQTGVKGGINGEADRRLQRYIAARLGPLPGWSMGYGFDLQEWVNDEQLGEWAKYMHKHMGWPHLLSARGYANKDLDILSYSNLGPEGFKETNPFNYEDAANIIRSDSRRPHFFEERFTYKRNQIFSMDVTRQLHWQYAMAGGVGSFWGFFPIEYGKVKPKYPKPEQLQTHYHFWHLGDWFKLDMSIANELTDGYALKTPDNQSFIFYKENTDSIQIDLTDMDARKAAVAVNTRKKYAEISLGKLNPKKQVIKLPEASDWAIAVANRD